MAGPAANRAWRTGFAAAVIAGLLNTACVIERFDTNPCAVTVVQMHDVPSRDGNDRVQEYEVLEPPYRVEQSSRDATTGEPTAWVLLFSDGWGPGRLDFLISGPGYGPFDGYGGTSELDTTGFMHGVSELGRHSIGLRQEASGCAETVEIETVPDADSWTPGDAETSAEFDWRRP